MTQIAFWIGHGEDDGQDVGRGRESSGWSMANEFGSWKPEMWNSTIASLNDLRSAAGPLDAFCIQSHFPERTSLLEASRWKEPCETSSTSMLA